MSVCECDIFLQMNFKRVVIVFFFCNRNTVSSGVKVNRHRWSKTSCWGHTKGLNGPRHSIKVKKPFHAHCVFTHCCWYCNKCIPAPRITNQPGCWLLTWSLLLSMCHLPYSYCLTWLLNIRHNVMPSYVIAVILAGFLSLACCPWPPCRFKL